MVEQRPDRVLDTAERLRLERRQRFLDPDGVIAGELRGQRREGGPIEHVRRMSAPHRSDAGGCSAESCARTRPAVARRTANHAPITTRLTAAVPRSSKPQPWSMKNPWVAHAEQHRADGVGDAADDDVDRGLDRTALVRRQRQIEQLVSRLVERKAEALIARVGEQHRPEPGSSTISALPHAERQRQHQDRHRHARTAAAPARSAAAEAVKRRRRPVTKLNVPKKAVSASAWAPKRCIGDDAQLEGGPLRAIWRRRNTSAASRRRYGARDDRPEAVRRTDVSAGVRRVVGPTRRNRHFGKRHDASGG